MNWYVSLFIKTHARHTKLPLKIWKWEELIGVQCCVNFNDHHYQVLLLLVEHRASMKSFQALQSPAIPLTLFHVFPVPLISPSIVLCHFSSAYLFVSIPEDFNLMLFSLLLLFLCVMCVQSNSISFFLSDFLLASAGWFSIVPHL